MYTDEARWLTLINVNEKLYSYTGILLRVLQTVDVWWTEGDAAGPSADDGDKLQTSSQDAAAAADAHDKLATSERQFFLSLYAKVDILCCS